MNPWKELSEEEKTPEAGYQEALRRIEACRVSGKTGLSLMDLNLLAVPPEIQGLTQLTRLYLYGNQIPDLEPIKGLTQLTDFRLNGNPLTSLRPLQNWLRKEPNLYFEESLLDGLHLKNVPLQDPPQAIARQGAKAILDHWLQQELGTDVNYTARILLLGDGEAGKTTLSQKLQNPATIIPPPDGPTPSTVGIDVHRHEFEHPVAGKPQKLTAFIWDFGGHEEEHLTHQSFLGPNSLYVILVRARAGKKNKEKDINHWLRMIDLLGKRDDGRPTNVLVVQNHVGMDQPTSIGLDKYHDTYPDLRLTELFVDLAKPTADSPNHHNWAGVVNNIYQHFSELPSIGKPAPGPVIGIQREMETARLAGRHYYSLAEWYELAAKHGVEKRETAIALLYYLKILGVVLYFGPVNDKDNYFPTLRDYVIIDPDWATDAIYFLLGQREIADQSGVFYQSTLDEAWAAYRTPEKMHEYHLLRSLLTEDALEVCFKAPHEEGKFIAASLLPRNRPEMHFKPKVKQGIRYHLHYPKGIPPGLVTRLVVRMSTKLEEGQFYRTGAVVHNEERTVAALFEVDLNDANKLEITVDRTGFEARAFLHGIREQVLAIHHKSFRDVTFEEQVPCTCMVCADRPDPMTYSRKALLGWESRDPHHAMDCNVGFVKVPVKEILEGTFMPVAKRPEHAFRELHEDIKGLKKVTGDTNQRVRSLQEALGDVSADLARQEAALFTNNREQRAFFRNFEAYLETLPDHTPQPLDDPAYIEGSTKDKIKIGIDAMKLLGRATGVEVSGFSLKWEREFEKGTFRLPRTWEEMRAVFVR